MHELMLDDDQICTAVSYYVVLFFKVGEKSHFTATLDFCILFPETFI